MGGQGRQGVLFLQEFGEHGLRQQLEDFMNGVPLRQLDEPEGLREWVGALRLLRCCERYTEAPYVKV